MNIKKSVARAVLVAALAGAQAWAEAPNLMTYQGRLQEGGNPVNANKDVNIYLCAAPSGACNSGCVGTGTQGVAVSNGLFRTTFTVPSSVNLNTAPVWLEVNVGPPGGSLTCLTPREQLTSSPYAIAASSVPAAGVLPGIAPSGVHFAGDVGIGFGSPLRRLHVYSGSSGGTTVDTNARAVFEHSNHNFVHLMAPNAFESGFIFGNPNSGTDAALLYNSNAPRGFTFRVNNNAILGEVITQDGRVGVGLAAPAARLHVSSGTGEAGAVMLVSTGATTLMQVNGKGDVRATQFAAPAGRQLVLGEDSRNPSGDGAPVLMLAGSPTLATGGGGGDIVITAGGNTPSGGSGYGGLKAAGHVNITGGSGYNTAGGSVTVAGGPTSTWALGSLTSDLLLKGGDVDGAGVLFGNGANAVIQGGVPSGDGTGYAHGGNFTINGGNAKGSGNKNGGNILLMPGSPTGSGLSGNVGIGAAVPNRLGFLSGHTVATIESGTSDRSGIIELVAKDVTGASVGRISFVHKYGGGPTFSELAAIQAARDGGANNSGALLFGTMSSGGLTDRMRLTKDGNVGIGNTNPGTRLEIDGGGVKVSTVNVTGAGLTGSETAFQVIGGTFTVTNQGFVGIGTPAPQAHLDIWAGSAGAHLRAMQSTPPTSNTPTACGSGATSSVTSGSTDMHGEITITSGAGSPSTCDTTFTFRTAYGSAPKAVMLTPSNANAASKTGYVSATTASSFTVSVAPAPTASTSMRWFYVVIE